MIHLVSGQEEVRACKSILSESTREMYITGHERDDELIFYKKLYGEAATNKLCRVLMPMSNMITLHLSQVLRTSINSISEELRQLKVAS